MHIKKCTVACSPCCLQVKRLRKNVHGCKCDNEHLGTVEKEHQRMLLGGTSRDIEVHQECTESVSKSWWLSRLVQWITTSMVPSSNVGALR